MKWWAWYEVWRSHETFHAMQSAWKHWLGHWEHGPEMSEAFWWILISCNGVAAVAMAVALLSCVAEGSETSALLAGKDAEALAAAMEKVWWAWGGESGKVKTWTASSVNILHCGSEHTCIMKLHGWQYQNGRHCLRLHWGGCKRSFAVDPYGGKPGGWLSLHVEAGGGCRLLRAFTRWGGAKSVLLACRAIHSPRRQANLGWDRAGLRWSYGHCVHVWGFWCPNGCCCCCGWWLVVVGCWLLVVGCCLLFAVWCLFVVCCLLFVVVAAHVGVSSEQPSRGSCVRLFCWRPVEVPVSDPDPVVERAFSITFLRTEECRQCWRLGRALAYAVLGEGESMALRGGRWVEGWETSWQVSGAADAARCSGHTVGFLGARPGNLLSG